MSLDLFVVLSRDLPDLQELARRFEGDVRGTWAEGLAVGGVELTLTDDAAPRVEALLASAKRKVKVAHVLQVTAGHFDDVEDVCELLLRDGGGALVSESGAVLLVRAPARKAKPKAAEKDPAPSRGFDTSIPPEVLQLLDGAQSPYELHPRDPPRARLSAIMKAVPVQVSDVTFGPSASPSTTMGSVHFSRARVVFRTSFEPWFVKQADPVDWLATLHLACGLARHTRGVLRRRLDQERDVRFDFAPDAPLPPTVPLAVLPCEHFAAVTLTRLRHGTGEMVGIGMKVALRWRILGETTWTDATVVLGGPKTNPALACLHGEQLDTTLRIDIVEPRGLSSHVPPCADGPTVALEVTVLKRLGS